MEGEKKSHQKKLEGPKLELFETIQVNRDDVLAEHTKKLEEQENRLEGLKKIVTTVLSKTTENKKEIADYQQGVNLKLGQIESSLEQRLEVVEKNLEKHLEKNRTEKIQKMMEENFKNLFALIDKQQKEYDENHSKTINEITAIHERIDRLESNNSKITKDIATINERIDRLELSNSRIVGAAEEEKKEEDKRI